MSWFTWTVNNGGRANTDRVDWFEITSSSGFYSVTAHFTGGSTATLVSSLASRADALAYIDSILTGSLLEGN